MFIEWTYLQGNCEILDFCYVLKTEFIYSLGGGGYSEVHLYIFTSIFTIQESDQLYNFVPFLWVRPKLFWSTYMWLKDIIYLKSFSLTESILISIC